MFSVFIVRLNNSLIHQNLLIFKLSLEKRENREKSTTSRLSNNFKLHKNVIRQRQLLTILYCHLSFDQRSKTSTQQQQKINHYLNFVFIRIEMVNKVFS